MKALLHYKLQGQLNLYNAQNTAAFTKCKAEEFQRRESKKCNDNMKMQIIY